MNYLGKQLYKIRGGQTYILVNWLGKVFLVNQTKNFLFKEIKGFV
jgi:hypothetical protein